MDPLDVEDNEDLQEDWEVGYTKEVDRCNLEPLDQYQAIAQSLDKEK